MPVLQVFDPPMCCSTGVCGPSVDPVLPRFAADLEWLRSQGVQVERCNLAQSPAVVARTGVVLKLLQDSPDTALPAVLVDGGLVHHGSYPERAALAAWAGLPAVRLR
ncbi:MAG TPA: arsenical resistance operon transcriptional repressor ArsD [Acidobacteria bacterium]|nr:arsenical resistance operon transcriptional repressor ArsD [Acidobacteriota bacterium]